MQNHLKFERETTEVARSTHLKLIYGKTVGTLLTNSEAFAWECSILAVDLQLIAEKKPSG